MDATYDILSHPILSDKAKAILYRDIDTFDALTSASERILGLHNTEFTGDKAEDAKLAVTLELNFEIERGSESDVFSRIKRNDRTWEFRDDISDVNPRAKIIADRLLAEDSDDISVRKGSTVAVRNSYIW